jgi:hypothetical protein
MDPTQSIAQNCLKRNHKLDRILSSAYYHWYFSFRKTLFKSFIDSDNKERVSIKSRKCHCLVLFLHHHHLPFWIRILAILILPNHQFLLSLALQLLLLVHRYVRKQCKSERVKLLLKQHPSSELDYSSITYGSTFCYPAESIRSSGWTMISVLVNSGICSHKKWSFILTFILWKNQKGNSY